MTVRNASAEAAKSRRCNAWSPRSYIATASWYVGFRTGGGGGAGGGGAWTGLTGFAGAFAAFTEGLDPGFRAGRWPTAPRLALRAGFRVDVRVFLVTRCDFAIGITSRISGIYIADPVGQ
jgi:hypothetical protein